MGQVTVHHLRPSVTRPNSIGEYYVLGDSLFAIVFEINFLGGIEVVANEYSKRATETVVSLGDKMRHLGTAGNEKRISQIKATATNFKRLIGLPWEHHIVQSMASGTFAAPYKLIKCNETGGAAVQLPDGNVYAIQQVMAMFLGKMKEIAEGWFQNIFVF